MDRQSLLYFFLILRDYPKFLTNQYSLTYKHTKIGSVIPISETVRRRRVKRSGLNIKWVTGYDDGGCGRESMTPRNVMRERDWRRWK